MRRRKRYINDPEPTGGLWSLEDRRVITGTSEEHSFEQYQDRMNGTCPVCGDYHPLNGMLKRVEEHWFKPAKEFRLYECRKCGTKWEVEIK